MPKIRRQEDKFDVLSRNIEILDRIITEEYTKCTRRVNTHNTRKCKIIQHKETKAQRDKSTKTQRYKDTKIQRHKDTKIQSTKAQNNKEYRIKT